MLEGWQTAHCRLSPIMGTEVKLLPLSGALCFSHKSRLVILCNREAPFFKDPVETALFQLPHSVRVMRWEEVATSAYVTIIKSISTRLF